MEEFDKFATRIYRAVCSRTSTSSKIWQPPEEGVIKINADAAVFEDGWIGLVVVARDHGEKCEICGYKKSQGNLGSSSC